MKTKFMQFIASLWEGWGEMKQVVENQPETTPLAACEVLAGQSDGSSKPLPAIRL